MFHSVLKFRDWLQSKWKGFQAHPPIAAILFIIGTVWAFHSFIRGQAPWIVLQEIYWFARPRMTVANIAIAVVSIAALASGAALVLGYYQQRTVAAEAETGRLRIEREREMLKLQLDVSRIENDVAAAKVTELQAQVGSFPAEVAAFRHAASKANIKFAECSFKSMVFRMEHEGVPAPTVTLRWVEAEDTELVDGMERLLRHLAPNWPIQKLRDSGSTTRQPGEARICFQSINHSLTATVHECFNAAMWLREEVEVFTKGDENLLVWVFPKKTGRSNG